MEFYPASQFNKSRDAYDSAVAKLSGDDAAGLEHAEVERRVQEGGMEVMRCLMQDHLDLRAAQEKASLEPMRGADGELRTEIRPSERSLGSLFGRVVVHRMALVKHGVDGGLRPLDAHLNLPDGLYSAGVQREVVWGVAQASYDATVDNLHRTTGTKIAKRQVEDLVVRAAVDFQEFYLTRSRQAERKDQLLILSFDGSGVVMRPAVPVDP